MRFIYTDEAGTSAVEPVSIVVGLVVHADTQWRPAAQLIRSLRATIPEQFRNDIAHAKTIWGSHKYRPEWSPEARTEFLCRMMSIPCQVGMGLAWAMVRRTAPFVLPPGYTLSQMQHGYAFATCMASADRYIRETGSGEIAAIVAEDVPEMRAFLRRSLAIVRARPHVVSSEHVFSAGSFAGMSPQAIEHYVTQVVDEVHFAGKTEAPLLQLADACAYALRRYFADLSYGETFVTAMLGGKRPEEVFDRNPEANLAVGLLGPREATGPTPPSGVR